MTELFFSWIDSELNQLDAFTKLFPPGFYGIRICSQYRAETPTFLIAQRLASGGGKRSDWLRKCHPSIPCQETDRAEARRVHAWIFLV